MKDNLIKEIETSLNEYDELSSYLKTTKFDMSNKTSKMSLGAAHSKKTDCLLNAMKLNEFLIKYYEESYPLPDVIVEEIKQYKQMVGLISVENGEVKYTKEYSDFITELESKMNLANGN
jgi:hypothetical protein